MKGLLNKPYSIHVLYFLTILLPLVIVLMTIFRGNISFWYDPARDFLLALDNLHKVTLIGPTSGIPGLFYGPYWIWFLSVGLLFSKDPRFVVFLILTVPYFTLFPLFLYKFKRIFDLKLIVVLWTYFIFAYGLGYATSPWNPDLAPLLFLIIIFIFIFQQERRDFKQKLYTYIGGVLLGLMLNIHISFSLGVIGGTIVYIILEDILEKHKVYRFKKVIIDIILVLIGILCTSFPFFIFELRHGFIQTQTILHVFTSTNSVVSVVGLSKEQILIGFFESFSHLVRLPTLLSLIAFSIFIGLFVTKIIRKKIQFVAEEKKILLFLGTVSGAILVLYLTTKNPVWSYHFIGVEILFLLLIGLVMSKLSNFRILFYLWAVIIIVINLYTFTNSIITTQLSSLSLAVKENIVKTIAADAGHNDYSVFAYSSALYTYDYSYLLITQAQKDTPYDPNLEKKDSPVAYVILPSDNNSQTQDFLHNHTPDKLYTTVQIWHISDTVIIKRLRK